VGVHVHQILVVGDKAAHGEDVTRRLSAFFALEFKDMQTAFEGAPQPHTLIDIDLGNHPALLRLKEWLKGKPENAKIIFLADRASRLQEARAYALGATGIIHRPVDRHALLAKLRDSETALATVGAAEEELPPGVVAATDALQSIFYAGWSGAPVNSTTIQRGSDAIVDQLTAQGLSGWIETVRKHHSQTYQHCLLVTGLAVAFGEHIGLSRWDRQRLSFAGMLHDIGKAQIPLAILEKPGPLDENEMAVMRKHPEYGLDALRTTSDLPAEMLDMVVHHHELLDGSGYPHGLHGSEVSDLVRIMTISDIFGALLERRSYKEPLSGDAAYQILLDMGPKLDRDLVRAFKFASAVDQRSAA
jgi:putative nucleotidyltransferase with HDIG domain